MISQLRIINLHNLPIQRVRSKTSTAERKTTQALQSNGPPFPLSTVAFEEELAAAMDWMRFAEHGELPTFIGKILQRFFPNPCPRKLLHGLVEVAFSLLVNTPQRKLRFSEHTPSSVCEKLSAGVFATFPFVCQQFPPTPTAFLLPPGQSSWP